MGESRKYVLFVAFMCLFFNAHCKEKDPADEVEEKPGVVATVSYDGRSILIDGKREILFSGSVHYPRMPVAMWGDILDKCKAGGLNVIQTYVFWNVHEPIKGKFNFTGNNDLVKFIRLVAEKRMWVTLRVGPFIQAEWNHGGLPYWLREEPNITYRTDNPAYKMHMERWVTMVINIMKDNKLFAPQGGPIIMSQIENEYDHVREAFDDAAERYIRWAGDMAVGLNTGVPWIMCKQKDAPGEVINACNGRHCGDTFDGPNSPTKPRLWTENWTAQYRVFGDAPSQRAAEDIAFSVARLKFRGKEHVVPPKSISILPDCKTLVYNSDYVSFNSLTENLRTLALVFFLTAAHAKEEDDGKLGVTYDARSLIINGQREFLYSGSVHYPRVPVEMWGDILDKCKEGGLNVIQTYVFWGLHEPVKGKYNFTGKYDVVKFFKMIAERGMWATLRVGPFVQGEWNNGGYPFWLRKEPNITYRTDNPTFKANTKRWVTKVVDLMKKHKLFASQGGPIILSQIENEYDHVRGAFRDGAAERYIKWAADMAVAQKTGVPWIMCKQKDAPDTVINACNGRHCGETFEGPNAPNKPSLWTENWTTQFKSFGEIASQRSAEDTAFGVARWFSKNGSHTNYYMYHGGTNFGRTASDFATTGYYDEAPIDHYGLLREPKYGHLKDLHYALTLSKKAILAGTYKIEVFGPEFEARYYEKDNLCAAFIWNNNTHATLKATFKGKEHAVPSKSVSILPDCKTVVYNTDHILSQHNAREFVRSEKANNGLKWEKTTESIPTKGNFLAKSPLEQLSTTEDTSDYLWYRTSIDLDNVDLPFKKSTRPAIQLRCLGDALLAFVNGKFIGTGHGYHRQSDFHYQAPANLKEGSNDIAILTTTVGMPDSGSYMERRMLGLRSLEIQGLGTGDLDLSYNGWHHTVGLEGEKHKYFTEKGADKAKWTKANGVGEPLTWYKAYFDAPEGHDPVAIRMVNMTKGMIWVNGKSIGRYWSSFLTLRQTPSQSEYHIPRSYLKHKDNFLVIFDEAGGKIDTVQIETVNRNTICSNVYENMTASVYSWKKDDKDTITPVDDAQPKASLKCPKDMVISHVDFASFGNPYGICGYFLLGNCTSPNSQKIVEEHCLGKDSCQIPVNRNLFDKDQALCPDVASKNLAVQVRCSKKE